ncbi:MAG: class I SAM-dependent methyltransferase [archaeon]
MDYYSQIADSYDELYAEEQLAKLKVVKEKIKDKGLVLDIGSGSGLSRGFFKDLVQLDPSLGLLKKSSGMRVCGMAECLPFKDHVFDSVISITSLHHTNIGRVVPEVLRVSKQDASFAFSILKRAKGFDALVSQLRKLKLKEEEIEKDVVLFKHVE